jgi:YebC/PmpR family DNA-binding regulatory protein
MSGHSKWAGIKHKKAIVDAKRGKTFSKVSKEISVAAKIGGGKPDMNPRLRLALEKAKGVNMPSDNIKRAIMKGTGELPGTTYEEVTYEGYGPGGVALMIETLTDNKNRTVGEIRHIMSKHNGNMGETGCVAWMFNKKGYILVNKNAIDE